MEKESIDIAGIPASTNDKVPAPARPFRHAVAVQLRFNDIDMLGHLNNAVYMSLFDLGKARYFLDVMPKAVNLEHINIVVVNINCNFHAPAYITEQLCVLTQVTSISVHSLVMEQRVVNVKTGEVKCTARVVMAGFDPATATGLPIAPEWTDALCRYEGEDLRIRKL
ncbi:MAG: acyl-CoA thioesterase [Pseudoflavonifractor sp.]|nr:acyl-CoA thioesterase [Pseudoflavonifractor sp.]